MQKSIVIARICGGLGNQMFIYAMARRLALKNNVPLRLDIQSGFRRDRYRRKYLLKYFNIQADIASPYESHIIGLGIMRRRIWMILSKFYRFDHKPYLIEENRCFDPRILVRKIKRKVYLQGLWQTERYFKDIEPIIRQDLKITKPFYSESHKMVGRIQNLNSVSLHARSYREVPPEDGAITLSQDYYHKAIHKIARQIDKPHFFCFSDVPDWLKANLKLEFPATFVNHNATPENDRAIEDLWLMSQCKHNIIANSSFSWWGAWLNTNPEKIVIAPAGNWNNKDLIPKTWITL